MRLEVGSILGLARSGFVFGEYGNSRKGGKGLFIGAR